MTAYSFTLLVEELVHLSVVLLGLSVVGLVALRRSLISILICLEIALLAVSLNFINFSIYLDDSYGQLFSFFILTIAGAESSIGLALLVVYHRLLGIIATNSLRALRG